jgi:hypothetical protein
MHPELLHLLAAERRREVEAFVRRDRFVRRARRARRASGRTDTATQERRSRAILDQPSASCC